MSDSNGPLSAPVVLGGLLVTVVGGLMLKAFSEVDLDWGSKDRQDHQIGLLSQPLVDSRWRLFEEGPEFWEMSIEDNRSFQPMGSFVLRPGGICEHHAAESAVTADICSWRQENSVLKMTSCDGFLAYVGSFSEDGMKIAGRVENEEGQSWRWEAARSPWNIIPGIQ